MRQHINYGWKFIPGFKEKYLEKMPSGQMVDIPHASIKTPLNCFSDDLYQGLFTYEKIFDYELKDNKHHFIVFEGAMVQIHVYFNGVDYGNHISSYTPVRIDVSESMKEKDNRLLVILDSREDPTIPPFGNIVDYTTFSGIYRPVYIESFKENYIKDLFVNGDMHGNLSINKEIIGKGQLSYQLFYGAKLVKEFKKDQIKIDDPILYSIEEPNLYTLRATLANGDEIETFERRFGFKTASFTSKGFYLNGNKIKLLGLNRHQNYPYVGCAMPKSMQVDDANIIKYKLGANVVRTSHYPQSEDFLSRCDEIGLLVIDEVPGWQFVSQDEKWRANYLYFIENMVKKERNHTSLIAYGVRIDESKDDDELYKKGNDLAHSLDPCRQTLGVRNFKSSHLLEDIYAYNDFSCSSLEHGADSTKTWVGAKEMPKLISEHNGHMFSTKSTDGSRKRTEQGLRHLKVINDAFGYDDLSGVIGWCAFDYNTHRQFGSADHICHHGVADIFRTPKDAGYAYLSQTSLSPVMWVSNPFTPGDIDEEMWDPIVIFTNCDYVELYKDDQYVGEFHPNKKDYPNLKHPPIIIDDVVGETVSKFNLAKKDSKIFAKRLSNLIFYGENHINPSDKSYLESMCKKCKIGLDDIYGFVVNAKKESIWKVIGYSASQKVIEKSFGPSNRYFYRVDSSADTLTNAETYDVARINVRLVDEYGTKATFANRTIHIKTQGPIALLSPEYVSLNGGSTAIYVRSLPTSESSYARIILYFEDAPSKSIDVFVI